VGEIERDASFPVPPILLSHSHFNYTGKYFARALRKDDPSSNLYLYCNIIFIIKKKINSIFKI